MSADLVQRLRDGVEIGEIDLADIMDAADEIQRLRLTEEEREAIDYVLPLLSTSWHPMYVKKSDVLRNLLQRAR